MVYPGPRLAVGGHRATGIAKEDDDVTSAWQRYVDAAGSLTQTTRKRAESIVRNLVKQGEIASDRAEKAVEDLLNRSEENRKAVASIVRTETERAVGRLGLARQSQVDRLAERVDKLEQQTGVGKKTQKKSAGKKSAGKKSAGKKGAAKKSSAKKSSAKKTGGGGGTAQGRGDAGAGGGTSQPGTGA